MAEVHAAHLHMKQPEAHVQAVEEDLEYYRVKRFEPRLIQMHRRGMLTFYEVMNAVPQATGWRSSAPPGKSPEALEQRIRALEDGLDDYVRTIALIPATVRGQELVVEDGRKESGSYDDFFRIAHKEHHGTLAQRVTQLEHDLGEYTRLVDALMRAAIAIGATTQEELDGVRAAWTTPSIWNGGRMVARAWVDPEFKQKLLTSGREAVRELGMPAARLGALGVAENTPAVHNVVVCTLCSCYPYGVLGDTPWWYKHDSYKERIVRDPRATIAEMFGYVVPPEREVRVYDSTSDVRWIVLPQRPAGTEGWSEADLARLVTQESLIGVADALTPEQLRAEGPPPPPRASRPA